MTEAARRLTVAHVPHQNLVGLVRHYVIDDHDGLRPPYCSATKAERVRLLESLSLAVPAGIIAAFAGTAPLSIVLGTGVAARTLPSWPECWQLGRLRNVAALSFSGTTAQFGRPEGPQHSKRGIHRHASLNAAKPSGSTAPSPVTGTSDYQHASNSAEYVAGAARSRAAYYRPWARQRTVRAASLLGH